MAVSYVGNDEPGKEILGRLDQLELGNKYIAIDAAHPTGTVTVELDEGGIPDYVIHENVAWDFIPLSSKLDSLAAEVDAVCFGSLCQRSKVSRDTIRRFLQATKPDCLRVFDINLRQHYCNGQVIDNMLRLTNVLKLNDEEPPRVAEIKPYKEKRLKELAGKRRDLLQKLEETGLILAHRW